ncbi:MAG: 2OG-Fe(II) oxygenase [Hyphomicrobium sp.]|jgi:hypothetical protein
MDQMMPPGASASHFITSLDGSRHVRGPFNYWLLENALTDELIDGIVSLPYEPPSDPLFVGKREANNSKRVYFNPENQARFPVAAEVAETFRSPYVVRRLEQLTGQSLAEGALRIEYCQDVDGFWLEPHLDLGVKLFTMLIYLSGEPELYDAGTDIYDASPEHNRVGTAPYEKNKGLIFIPGHDTWHGFSKRPINGVRRSIIVNWVTSEWRARHELA